MILFILGTSSARAGEPQRSVLILSSEDSLLSATRILTDSIVAPLRDAFPVNLTIFTEFMNSSRGFSLPLFERNTERGMAWAS